MYLFLHVEISVTFKVLSIWCNTPIKIFFHCSNSFWTQEFWCLFSHLRQDQVNRECGEWGSCPFWSKTAEHSMQCGQVHSWITNHEMDKHAERVLNKMHWSWLQPLTTTPAGTLKHRVPRTLTYWGKAVLQGAHPPKCNSGFLWAPLIWQNQSILYS